MRAAVFWPLTKPGGSALGRASSGGRMLVGSGTGLEFGGGVWNDWDGSAGVVVGVGGVGGDWGERGFWNVWNGASLWVWTGFEGVDSMDGMDPASCSCS